MHNEAAKTEKTPDCGTKSAIAQRGLRLDEIQLTSVNASDVSFLRRATDNLITQLAEQKVEMVLLLDRGARPIAHLLRSRWSVTREDAAPEIRFVNIGREKSFVYKTHWYHTDKETLDGHAAALRAIFRAPGTAGQGSTFDGKKVAIIDDYAYTSRTVNFAQTLLSHAFPKATFIHGAFAGYERENFAIQPLSYSSSDSGPRLPQPPTLEYADRFMLRSQSSSVREHITELERRVRASEWIDRHLPSVLARWVHAYALRKHAASDGAFIGIFFDPVVSRDPYVHSRSAGYRWFGKDMWGDSGQRARREILADYSASLREDLEKAREVAAKVQQHDALYRAGVQELRWVGGARN